MIPPAARLDPDRFFNRTSPGAHEWWYFDAIGDDGRDAIVIVWYAGLPFDPSYGVATLRHLRNPGKYAQPRALDHSAIGFSWYRDGKTIAYALNGFKADRFRHQAEPFAVEVDTSRVERDEEGYKLTIATPSVEGRPIRAEFRFKPADSTEPFERDLGSPGVPHNWILAAPDCRVEGHAMIGRGIGSQLLTFSGRGYHDHNAGAEDLSVAMRRWEWGRVHHGALTNIYYTSEPRRGEARSLWLTCRDGRPEVIREGPEIDGVVPKGSIFGLRHDSRLLICEGLDSLSRSTGPCLDDGPFYRRWIADFALQGVGAGVEGDRTAEARGIAELLDTRNLHKPLFNWMIPYRLKWPS